MRNQMETLNMIEQVADLYKNPLVGEHRWEIIYSKFAEVGDKTYACISLTLGDIEIKIETFSDKIKPKFEVVCLGTSHYFDLCQTENLRDACKDAYSITLMEVRKLCIAMELPIIGYSPVFIKELDEIYGK